MIKRELGRPMIVHPYAWLWEPLSTEPSFVLRTMFGTKAAYLDGKLMLCFSAKTEPWRGVLVCTDKVHHASLIADFKSLRAHTILPKWLYLPESTDDFEAVGLRLITLVRKRDQRIGVAPQPRQRKRQ